MERKPVEIAWEITDQCNLDCIHCYNPRDKEDLDFSFVLDVLNQAKKLGVEKIKYGGGEPLLREDFLDILSETINLGFDTTFSTNGYVVDREVVERIKNTRLERVQVSLDGNEATHNYIRQNDKAYSRALNAIELFVRGGFKVSVATTLMKPNLNCLDELFQTCSELGVNRWRVMKYIPISRRDLIPVVAEYKACNLELKELRERAENLDVFIAKEFDELGESKSKEDFVCFGGRTVLSIKANGNVSPCSYFPHLIIGNVKSNKLEEIWNSKKMLEFAVEIFGNPKCEYFRNCEGGCKAATYYANKIKKCDPYCWVKRNQDLKGKVRLLREKNRVLYESKKKLTLFPDGTLSNTWCNY